MLGEEGSDTPGTSGLRWIVDPLDGTTNFLFGIPQWCVSIAVEDAQGMLAGVVYDPMRDEVWAGAAAASRRRSTASRCGARERSARARHRARRDRLRLRGRRARRAGARSSRRLLPRVRDIRRIGSAALDLAWTAAGRYDAYYERGIKLWDYRGRRADLRERRARTSGGSIRRRPRRRASSSLRVALADELASLVD